MVRSDWLNEIALGAPLLPLRLKLSHSLAPVPQKFLDVLRNAIKPVVLNVLNFSILAFNCLQLPLRLPLLNLLPQRLNSLYNIIFAFTYLKVFGTTWFHDSRKKVVIQHVIK